MTIVSRGGGGGGGGGGIVLGPVRDAQFANFAELANWSRTNLATLRNNNILISASNPYNRGVAIVAGAVYQWIGINQPTLAEYDAYTEIPWIIMEISPDQLANIAASIKDASLSGNIVTFTKNDDSTITIDLTPILPTSLADVNAQESVELETSYAAATMVGSQITLTRNSGDTTIINIASASNKRYEGVRDRRDDFTLGFDGQANDPGYYYVVDSEADVTLPSSTSDDQLGVHWGIANTSFGMAVTLTPSTATPGHTVIIEGFSRPYELPSGQSIDLVLVDRTATSSSYRIMNQSSGIEGLMGVTQIAALTTANIFGISGRPVHYKISASGTANITALVAGLGLLPQGESCRALIENVDPTQGINLSVPTGTTFRDTITSIIAIEPGNSRWITITNNSGTMEVNPDGPIIYEFLVPSHDITNTGDGKGDWVSFPSVYSEIISSPTELATQNHIEAGTGAGFLMEFTLMADLAHGSESSSVSSLINVSGDLNDSGTGVTGPSSTRRVRGGTGAAQESAEINKTWQVSMASGSFFNLLLTGFPSTGAGGARLLNPWAKIKVFMKR